ncbi:MAG: SRPBCC family protein [Chloroflexota bacterium]
MPKASMQFKTVVPASKSEVFSYVSDLTKHGDWAGNELVIVPEDSGAGEPTTGRTYKSTATVRNLQFNAVLTVTEYAPNNRFAFKGEDSTGKFVHTFAFEAAGRETKVVRTAEFDLSVYLWIRFWVLYLPVRRPAGIKAMTNLAERFN